MKKYNKDTGNFEDYSRDTRDIALIEQLRKDSVPYINSREGIIIEDKDLVEAVKSKNKLQ